MEFWYGLLIGLFVGSMIGVVAMGWLAAGRIADIRQGYERDAPYRR